MRYSKFYLGHYKINWLTDYLIYGKDWNTLSLVGKVLFLTQFASTFPVLSAMGARRRIHKFLKKKPRARRTEVPQWGAEAKSR